VNEMGCGGGSSRSNDNYEERAQKSTNGSNEEALKILNVRLAKGEITRQQYDEMKATIAENSGGAHQQAQSQTTGSKDESGGKRRRWFSRGGC
jgi:hypothetical protein